MMCGLYREGVAVRQVSVLQSLCLCAASVALGVVLSSATAQQKTHKPTIGNPTTMKRAESDFAKKLDTILAEVNRANQELHAQGIQLDRIESNTSEPEIIEPPPEPQQEPEPQPIVRLYTADSSWQCAACEQQKRKLKENPPSFDYETILGPSEGRSPTGKYPAWELIRPDGSRSVKSGQYSTESLEKWVSNAPSVTMRKERYSADELRQWIRSQYQPSTFLTADVKPRSAVWSHLQDSNHGFTSAQVRGLQHWEAMALHDAHHRERITPFRGSAKAVRARRTRVIERPHYAYWSAS